MKIKTILLFPLYISVLISTGMPLTSRSLKEDPVLDEKVRKFLSENSCRWYDMNVPETDGRLTTVNSKNNPG
jgi:alpha-glucuronidase